MRSILTAFCILTSASAVTAQLFQSIGPATQVHASANHWGNSAESGMLINTVYYPAGLFTSRVAWQSGGAAPAGDIDSYDVGLYCISGSCVPGRLYAHTGPLLSSDTNAAASTLYSRAWAIDPKAVCQRFPCPLPEGIYSLSTGTSEVPMSSMTVWGDGSTLSNGGTEFHNVNTTSDPTDSYVSGWIKSVSNTHPTGSTTQVTLMVNMLQSQHNQPIGCVDPTGCDGFLPDQRILVSGLSPAACSGYQVVDSVDTGGSSGALKFTIDSNVTCMQITGSVCSPHLNKTGYPGCVSAGLPLQLNQIPTTDVLNNGFFCFPNGAGCVRSSPAGPAGPQTVSHSVGFTAY